MRLFNLLSFFKYDILFKSYEDWNKVLFASK